MLFCGDEKLDSCLFDAGILYLTSKGDTAISATRLGNAFKDIAYVVLKPQPDQWEFLGKAAL